MKDTINTPTHIETLQKPEQQARIKWLKDHCLETNILDIGCNWGYILNELNGQCGVDLNPDNIDIAMKKFPQRAWLVADVTKGLPFENAQYGIVIMADILEHLDWAKVEGVLREGLRIARGKLLITLPWKLSTDCACCFKHKWIPVKTRVGEITVWLAQHSKKVSLEYDLHFVYIDVLK